MPASSPVVSALGCKRVSFPLAQAQLVQGPFAPRALPRLDATTDPSDSLAGHPGRLCISAGCRGTTPAGQGLSSSQLNLSMRAAPFTPGSRPAACTCCFAGRDRLRPLRRLGRSHWCHEAKTGSLALRLASSPRGASPPGLLPANARPATWQTGHSMVDSFHSTRLNWLNDAPKGTKARLAWASGVALPSPRRRGCVICVICVMRHGGRLGVRTFSGNGCVFTVR